MKSFQSDPKPCKLMWFKPTGEHQPLHHVVNSMETFLVMAFFAVSITLKISLSPKFLILVFLFQKILNLNERTLWSDHHHAVLCLCTWLGVSEAEKQLSFLADVAVAPSCGKYGCCSCPDLSQVEKSIWLQLQFFLSKTDCVLDCLIQG